MGRKAAIASTGAGISLLAAAAVLVIAVSSFVAFRGFDTARATTEVRQDAHLAALDAAAPHPQRVVVGQRTAVRKRPTRRSARRPAVARRPKAVPMSPAVPRQTGSDQADTPLVKRAAPAPTRPAPHSPMPVAQVPEQPAEELVGQVSRPAETLTEKVGDALLDVRDALP